MIRPPSLAAALEGSPPDVEFDVDVWDSFEKANITREEWDEFVLNIGGDLYVTYDWCRIWWRHYGENRCLRLYVFRNGSRLVGLAPMFIERMRLGPITIKIAKRVGSDFALTIFALPLAPDQTKVVYWQLLMKLIQDEKCDCVSFSLMPGPDPTLAGLRLACEAHKGILSVARDEAAGPHTNFHLPDTFEKYLSALDRRQRQNYRRRLKLLNESFRIENDVVKEASQARTVFADFMTLHENQWRKEGKPGHFGDWPRSTAFNTDLVEKLSGLDRFRMTRLLADNRVIGYQYAFVFGKCCYWRLPARAPEKEMDRFGLGVIGMVQLFDAMIKEGVQEIEAGVGHYNYKIQFDGEELQARSFLVAAARPGGAWRARLFLRLSDLLHLLYYRLWRLRVVSRLPLPARSLWHTWIRSRP
jgi:CelD/BcsL family acetyltransferase involved in cellulose biosynthesis